jgi:hypothetical protein
MSNLKMIGGASALFKALGQIDKTSDRSYILAYISLKIGISFLMMKKRRDWTCWIILH